MSRSREFRGVFIQKKQNEGKLAKIKPRLKAVNTANSKYCERRIYYMIEKRKLLKEVNTEKGKY